MELHVAKDLTPPPREERGGMECFVDRSGRPLRPFGHIETMPDNFRPRFAGETAPMLKRHLLERDVTFGRLLREVGGVEGAREQSVAPNDIRFRVEAQADGCPEGPLLIGDRFVGSKFSFFVSGNAIVGLNWRCLGKYWAAYLLPLKVEYYVCPAGSVLWLKTSIH